MQRNPSILRRQGRKRKGFTLVELLTVVLVLSILMSVAMPLYLNALDNSKKRVCRANMQTIANAVVSARNKARAADFTTFIAAGVTTTSLTDLMTVPRCPNGGAYSLATGSSGSATTFQVKCSATYPLTHGKFEPGYDFN